MPTPSLEHLLRCLAHRDGHLDCLLRRFGRRQGVVEEHHDPITTVVVERLGDDPVDAGLVASLARPGGNLTGVSFLVVDLVPKLVELLSELVSQAKAVALLVNPGNSNAERVIKDVEGAALSKGLQLHVFEAGTASEIDAAFAALAQLHVDALVVWVHFYDNDPATPFTRWTPL